MKLISAIGASLIASSFAQNADDTLTRGMSGQLGQIAKVYSQVLSNDPNVSQANKYLAAALQARIERGETPANVEQMKANLLNAVSSSMGLGQTQGYRNIQCDNGSCDLILDVDALDGYGCWCHLGDGLTKGVGTPRDPYDSACKSLQGCARCAEEDFGDEGCDAASHNYNVPFLFSNNRNAIETNCIAANPNDNCAQALCMCQVNWLNNVLQVGFGGNGVSPALSHDNFDGSQCATSRGGSTGQQDNDGSSSIREPKTCCGNYPERFPFNLKNSSCCDVDGNIFDPNTKMCCDTVGVSDLGSC